jgi:hypothetical protein
MTLIVMILCLKSGHGITCTLFYLAAIAKVPRRPEPFVSVVAKRLCIIVGEKSASPLRYLQHSVL